MGLLGNTGSTVGNWFGKAKNFAGNAIGKVGGIARRVGEVGGKILRGIGDAAPFIADGLALGSMALGQPELAAGAALLGGVIQRVGEYSNKGAAIASKIEGIGSLGQTLGNKLVG